MAVIITQAGLDYMADLASQELPLVIETIVFADIDGLDTEQVPPLTETRPDAGDIVHESALTQIGKAGDDTVIYSKLLGSDVGDWYFNWVGLWNETDQVLIAVSYNPRQLKRATSGSTGGNILTRNVGVQYTNVASLANVVIDAETWQLDMTALLANMQAQVNSTASDMTDLLASIPEIIAASKTVGEIIAWPLETPPAEYLECDGSAISRTTYDELFSIIGVTYGNGDGSTTFNLPDLRGQFLRGWDHGSGIDPDAAIRTDRGDGTAGDHVGTKQDDANPLIAYDDTANGQGPDLSVIPTGSETRPTNVAVMYCIRYTGTPAELPEIGSVDVATAIDAADEAAITDASNVPFTLAGVLKRITWLNIKTTLLTYFDSFYAAIGHNHDADYADIAHDHDGSYSAIGHNHDADYADIAHNHDADYAAIVHNHDADYAAIVHNHDLDYAPIAPTASQVEAEAGTSTDIRRWTPLRVAQAIGALAPGGSSEAGRVVFKGSLTNAASFPASPTTGDEYRCTELVTDNDAGATNTGQMFDVGDIIRWNGTAWVNTTNRDWQLVKYESIEQVVADNISAIDITGLAADSKYKLVFDRALIAGQGSNSLGFVQVRYLQSGSPLTGSYYFYSTEYTRLFDYIEYGSGFPIRGTSKSSLEYALQFAQSPATVTNEDATVSDQINGGVDLYTGSDLGSSDPEVSKMPFFDAESKSIGLAERSGSTVAHMTTNRTVGGLHAYNPPADWEIDGLRLYLAAGQFLRLHYRLYKKVTS